MPTGFSEISREIEALLAEVEGVDVRVPEDSALIGIAVDLLPKVIDQLERGVALLEKIEASYDPDRLEALPEDDDPFSLKGIGFLISSEFAARDLTDLAFFARTELRGSLELLRALRQRDNLDLETVASNCEAGSRRLRKAMVSVESALYEFEERAAPRRKWFDVEVSIQIRKLYWNLRRETLSHPAEDKLLTERLRGVVYRLVAFRELSVYPFLRIDDRIQLRHLLKRILEWLNDAQRGEEEGHRLWRDLEGFAGLLVQVSQRQELQDHDRALIARAYRTLFRQTPPPEEVSDKLLDDLDSLLGLDDGLDGLIVSRTGDPHLWHEPLVRVREGLSRSEERATATLDLWNEV